ncbi:MAG: flagellar basal body P-ring formation chaperone FlgA [Planctomycetota bacterium]
MLLALLTTLLGGGSVTVTVPTEAKVKGTEIELGEVAQVTGLDGELVSKVRAFELGYAPAPGFSRLMTAERIRADLAKAMPSIEIRVTGERACRVWPAVSEVDPKEVEDAARAALLLAFDGKEATFTLKDPIGALTLPIGDRGRAIVAKKPSGELKSGVVGVPVELMVDGTRYRTLWTSWRVEVWETRDVLNRPVRAGEELSPQHFERQRVRVGHEADVPRVDSALAIGAVARRDLAPGEAVTTSDLARPLAVTKNTTIYLRVKKGSIEARVAAVALDSGVVGEKIQVQAVESRQVLFATVTGRDACEIKL